MYRRITPTDEQQLSLRMLFQPTGEGLFLRAAEADSFAGLVSAILDDPDYEMGDIEARLLERLRLADDCRLLAQVAGDPDVNVSDQDGERTINVSSDTRFIRSLDRLGFVSLDPSVTEPRS
ncbi:MAG TPA: hypothetical protein VMV16_03550 [Solirubrobacteraceae bacterium]|nr:hypothetical protein [Solirubrobacteraceae bacterium]